MLRTIVAELSRLPHRGAATPNEAEAARLLETYLTEMGADVRIEPFRTPKTYVSLVYWLLGGIVFGLSFSRPSLWVALFVWIYVVLAWLYFNWRSSPVTTFPPLSTGHNVIGRWEATADAPAPHIVLMAHYDTAPVSLLYGPRQQTSFRASLILSLSLMLLAGIAVTVEAIMGAGLPWLPWVRYGLIAYFLGQAILGTAGYWQHGYTNGASDNATGVAAALATAERLRALSGVTVEVALTSAEEAGMIGAQHYVNARKADWPAGQTMAINFDTLGAGKLTVVEQTGTVEVIRYNNEPTRLARALVDTAAFKSRAQVGRWHTADFDSVWFVRADIPILALCALDPDGRMPRIHRPDDRAEAVDLTPVQDAVDLAEAVVWQWLAGR